MHLTVLVCVLDAAQQGLTQLLVLFRRIILDRGEVEFQLGEYYRGFSRSSQESVLEFPETKQ